MPPKISNTAIRSILSHDRTLFNGARSVDVDPRHRRKQGPNIAFDTSERGETDLAAMFVNTIGRRSPCAPIDAER